jgi:hypothetical protein
MSPDPRAASTDRQSFFHSNLQEFLEGPPVTARFAYLRTKGDTFIQNPRDWTEADVLRFANGCARLNRGLDAIKTEGLDPSFLGSLRST